MTKEEAQELIDSTYELNKEVNKKTKTLTENKNKIKEFMREYSLDNLPGGSHKALLQEVTKQTMNPERTLLKVDEIGAEWLVDTIRVANIDKLEDSLMKNELDAKDFAECIDTNTSYRLTFK